MLDLRYVVSNVEEVKKTLIKRNMAGLTESVDALLSLDERRKASIKEVEALKHERNVKSNEMAMKKKAGESAEEELSSMRELSKRIKELDQSANEVNDSIKKILLDIPNILHLSVPEGRDFASNRVEREWGQKKQFNFEPKSHFEIGEKMGILDFQKAGEVVGSRFVFLKGLAAKMERALIQFMLETHSGRGYEEIMPPVLVNRNALTGTGQLPKFEEDVFCITKYDLFLSPTAEVQLTNYHRDEVLEMKSLTRKYVAYTPCFRSEAGSYGKDTRGLKRQHQFNKVELVKFSTAEKSFEELESLTADAENILQLLNLPYRVVTLCAGDIGFGSSKTYDIEVWSPPNRGYMEISSCSNFLDFQARRANIRVKNTDTGRVEYVHTLNGSGLAVGRTMIAIIENYQTPDGRFEIPEVLKKYMP